MSGIFDLDTAGRRALEDEAAAKPLDFTKVEPGAWAGSGEALKGLLRPSASAGRSLMMVGAVPGIMQDRALSAVTGQDVTFNQDRAFELSDDLGSSAVEYWTPNPEAMGAAAKALNVGGMVAGSIPQLIGTPGLFLTQSAMDPATDLVRQGVDSDTAMAVGGINLAVNAVGMRLPAAWGNTLAQRIGTGAGSNLALGVGADVGSAQALEQGGYERQANSYDAADPYARGLDVLMGAAFGVRAHIDAPLVVRDSVLTERNSDHLEHQTLPGVPVGPEAVRQHQTAMSSAIDAVLRGEPVDVSAVIATQNFILRPELQPTRSTPPPAADIDYGTYRRTLESGMVANARSSSSTATGIDQFTAGTWRRIVSQEKPAWAQGMSDAEILAQRTNPERSGEMVAALDRQNVAALEAAGLTADRHSLYATHHFGMERGVEFARAGGDVRIERILTKQQIAANPYLRGKTKAEVIANWDERARRAGLDVRDSTPMPREADALQAESFAAADGLPPRAPTEVGAIIDQRIATLEELAGQNRLQPEQLADLRAEDAELVAVIRQHERLTRGGVIPADPRGRLSADELQLATQRRVEIRQQIEASQSAGGYARQLDDLRNRLDKIDNDADLARVADQLQPRTRMPEPARQPEPGAAQPITTGPVRQGVEPFVDVRGPDPLAQPVADIAFPAARGAATETPARPDQPAPERTAAAATEPTQPRGTDRAIAETTPAAARAATEVAPDLTITLDDGTTIRAADALAEAEAGIARAQNDSAAFRAAMACAMRFM